VLDYRANGRFMELHRDDVVLARGLWWRRSAQSELPTVGPKAATAALVGGEALVEIGRQLRVVEHRQAMGNLREDGLERRRSGAGCPRECRARPELEETAAEKCGSGARKLALELEEQDVGVRVMLLRMRDRDLRRRGGLSTATRRWRPAEARGRRGARARGQQGRGKRSGKGGDEAWARAGAGGGARGAASAASGGGRSKAEGEAAVTEEEEAGRCQGTCLRFSKNSGTSR
jgi:hypothetical protein